MTDIRFTACALAVITAVIKMGSREEILFLFLQKITSRSFFFSMIICINHWKETSDA